MEQQLYCGAARENITPSEDLLGKLRGLMDTHFGGVVDDLYIRVIALQNKDKKLLLVSGDLDKVPNPEENLKALEMHTGVPQDNILYISIHTHSAPVTGYRPYEGPNFIARKPVEVQEATKQYEQFILEKLLLAAKRALDSMAPATVGYAYGSSEININRIAFYEVTDEEGNTHVELGTGTNVNRPADRTLFVMKFADLEGKPIAFFVNYPVHNTVMILNGCGKDGSVGISSDMGGNVSKYIEKEYEGSVAMWSSGAAGDLNPVMSNQVYREDPKTGAPVEYYEKDPAIPLSMLHTLVSHHFADVQKTIRKISNNVSETQLSAGTIWAEVPGKDEEGNLIPYKVRVQKIAIGPVVLMGFSGELYSALGRIIKDACGRENLILINHDASLLYNSGYIYSDEAFALADQYDGQIVGMNHTWLQPGYITQELIRCVKTLLEEEKEV